MVPTLELRQLDGVMKIIPFRALNEVTHGWAIMPIRAWDNGAQKKVPRARAPADIARIARIMGNCKTGVTIIDTW